MQKTLVVLVGPTAVGKTNTAINLAHFLDTEIISADSRQVYTELNIGTAKPTLFELENIPHHLLGHVSIHRNYSVADYENDANQIIEQLFLKYDTLILTGGSGLYIDAVCNGLDDLPESDPNLKNQLTQILNEHGIEKLQSKLYELDPAFYQSIDLQNPHRLIRAIEVCMLTGKKFSDLRLGNKKQNSFRLVKIGLNLPRENLYERINLRVHKMLLDGLLEEAESLYKYRALKALKTVGYSELFNFLENKNTLEDAVQMIQQNSRRYAKRQLTWFRKDQEVQWFDSARFDEIKAFLEQKI